MSEMDIYYRNQDGGVVNGRGVVSNLATGGSDPACHQQASIEFSSPMSKSARKSSPGSGRRPIPSNLYLLGWGHVVEMLKAGDSTVDIRRKNGTCSETVRRVRKSMLDEGIPVPPKRVPAKIERPKRPKPPPRPPKVGMTQEERLRKHSGVVAGLVAGNTMKQVAALEGVSVNTVRVVRRAIAARGKLSAPLRNDERAC
jgi:uncharacterized protein YerC